MSDHLNHISSSAPSIGLRSTFAGSENHSWMECRSTLDILDRLCDTPTIRSTDEADPLRVTESVSGLSRCGSNACRSETNSSLTGNSRNMINYTTFKFAAESGRSSQIQDTSNAEGPGMPRCAHLTPTTESPTSCLKGCFCAVKIAVSVSTEPCHGCNTAKSALGAP